MCYYMLGGDSPGWSDTILNKNRFLLIFPQFFINFIKRICRIYKTGINESSKWRTFEKFLRVSDYTVDGLVYAVKISK